jgi:hypothetical protein
MVSFRAERIAPKKSGKFVTLWKGSENGDIRPYDLAAGTLELFIVSVRDAEHFGQFVFPKRVLFEKDIVSKEEKGGTRATHIYPPRDVTIVNKPKVHRPGNGCIFLKFIQTNALMLAPYINYFILNTN